MDVSQKMADVMCLWKSSTYTLRVSGKVFLVAENDKVSPRELQFLTHIFQKQPVHRAAEMIRGISVQIHAREDTEMLLICHSSSQKMQEVKKEQ